MDYIDKIRHFLDSENDRTPWLMRNASWLTGILQLKKVFYVFIQANSNGKIIYCEQNTAGRLSVILWQKYWRNIAFC